jgi:hypothetical protein
MKTLQEQYNLIKEGKGHKDVFLKEAKRIYPNLIPNSSNFEHTSKILKEKSIISEMIWGVVGSNKQPDWFKVFNETVNEAKVEEKETTKEVNMMKTKGFDYTDLKNIDNLYGEEFLKGYYTEMKDPKNSEKTVKELKEIVAKNLAKDRLHYVKDGQFGVKGLGYVTEHPGLGTPKEPKGKYKSSGYGDLDKKLVKESLNNKNNMVKLVDLLEGEYYELSKKEEKKDTKKPTKEVKKSLVADKIKEIEQQGSVAALEAKMNALEEEIRMREDKLRMVQENEDLQEFINPTRINEMEKEIKELSKAKEKYDKLYEKMAGGKKKEVIDEKEEIEEDL